MEDEIERREREMALRAESLTSDLLSSSSLLVHKSLKHVAFVRSGYMHHAVLIDDLLLGEVSAGSNKESDQSLLLQKVFARFVIRRATMEELRDLVVISVVPEMELRVASARLAAMESIWNNSSSSVAMPYHLLASNCEHVSRFVATGLFESQQGKIVRAGVSLAKEHPKAALAVGIAAAAGAALAAFWYGAVGFCWLRVFDVSKKGGPDGRMSDFLFFS